jgi:hypothetical protein
MPKHLHKHLRYRGKSLRDHVTDRLPPKLRTAAWQNFQQFPVAQWANWIISQIEPQEVGMFRRRRRPKGHLVFDDLTLPLAGKALRIYERLCHNSRWRLIQDHWLRPILAGRARDLALRPDAHGREWGRRSLRRLRGKRSWQRRVERDREVAYQHMREISQLGVRARMLKKGALRDTSVSKCSNITATFGSRLSGGL